MLLTSIRSSRPEVSVKNRMFKKHPQCKGKQLKTFFWYSCRRMPGHIASVIVQEDTVILIFFSVFAFSAQALRVRHCSIYNVVFISVDDENHANIYVAIEFNSQFIILKERKENGNLQVNIKLLSVNIHTILRSAIGSSKLTYMKVLVNGTKEQCSQYFKSSHPKVFCNKRFCSVSIYLSN